MENSGEVTIEGENYEVVDECVEEEDTSIKMQSKCAKQVDVEKQSMDITAVNNDTPNKDIEQNDDINMEKNENTSKENNKDISKENNEDINKENNEDTNKAEINEDTNKAEINKDTNKAEINKDTNKENNEDTNKEDNEDTNKEDIIKENNEDTSKENNEDTSKENNEDTNKEDINKENNEDTNTAKINEDTNTAKINEDTNTAKINEDTNTTKINEDTNTAKINEDTNTAKINEDTNTAKMNEDTNIAKMNEDTNKANNDSVNMQTNEDVRIEESSDINMVKHDDIVVIDLTDNSLPNNSDSNINIQDNSEKGSPQQLSVDTIDFTEDITLDQFNQQKDVIDEDVLHHLDAIENIVFDSRDFQIRKEQQSVEKHRDECYNSENNSSTEQVEVNENSNTNEKIPHNMNKDFTSPVEIGNFAESEWYEKKLAEKEAIIKERLTKVAKVLGISYPCYEQWLEYEETVNGSPLCKLKPSRRCCLDKPHTNRWKFICTRRRIEESSLIDDINTCNKNAETVWKVEPSGQWGVNINNAFQFPDFVLRAVKVFEDFLQTTDQLTSQNSMSENVSDDTSVDTESKKDVANEAKQYWLWLVVRCNSMDELMLFATGKNISRSTMDKLKQVYESGSGKDCNVKSLYCKSTNKFDDTTVTDTTFLVGSEALDEIVGGLKVQLAPKTNFWSNTAGAVNVANTVMDLLAPNPSITVLEIGCGIGLIGLMLASKCRQIIGVDNPSEVEEAELTCELNNINNASFIMGSPHEVTTKIINAVKNRKAFAIINANTNIGRATEVMTCLRKIPSLKRIAMITTLTKQSVRAILELARPGDQNHGAPFIPVVACVVDTLPIGAHFEAVIILQRRAIHKFNLWFQKTMQGNVKNVENKTVQNKIIEQNTNEKDKKLLGKGPELQTKQKLNKPNQLTKTPAKKQKVVMNKPPYAKNTDPSLAKIKFKGKRPHSPDKTDASPKKLLKKLNKFGPKPWQTVPDASIKKKKEWNTASPELRINPLYEKKIREHKEQTDLRERLSNNRADTDIAQTVKEHQALLEIAKEKLSGPTPTVDVNTAKQLQNMLNMVLEQTSKLQSQLPRSVWDRIAPPENVNLDQNVTDDPLFKDRYVQEMSSQDILITTPNKTFLNSDEPEKPIYKKYHNLLPLEPNTVMPPAQAIGHKDGRSFRITFERFHENDMRQQQMQENSWNRGNTFERNRWNEVGNMKKSMSPIRRQTSPKRPLLSPPRRPCSPPRRHFSPLRRPMSPMYRQRSPMRRQISPLRRPVSPKRMSPSWQPLSPRRLSSPRRTEMFINRSMSPLKRQVSPSRRPMSPMRSAISPSRRETSTMKRPMSPPRRQIPSPNRMMSTNKQELLFPKTQTIPQERQHTSTMKRAGSPPRFLFERPTSPPGRQQSPQRRQMSPQRFADDWDIPSRGAIEQTWNRSNDRVSEQNVWQTDKASASSWGYWGQTTCNDRSQKSVNQEKWENPKVTVRNDNWNSGANDWSSKTWSSGADNRWSAAPNMPGSSTDNWNIHGKDNFPGSKDPWVDNKKKAVWEPSNVKDSWKQMDKEDVNDLPEDAKDPWGDDGTSDLKERWLKYENSGPSSVWVRENEQGDSWRKHNKDNWQNKGTSFTTKPQWQNNGVQNAGESRWHSQNDGEKKASSSNWQNGNTTGPWQFKNSNFQSQRPFSTNQFKGY